MQPVVIHIHGDVHVHLNGAGDGAPFSFNGLGELTRIRPEVSFNTDRTYKNGKAAPNGIELRFGTVRPTQQTRDYLKEHGFRFSEKQTLWYAKDGEVARKVVDLIESGGELEVDTTQYVKNHFWARVKSMGEYERFYERTEFMVAGEPSLFYYRKAALAGKHHVSTLIEHQKLFFKKFYNTVANEDGSEPSEPGQPAASPPRPAYNHLEVADRLKALADGMQQEIDSKINSATSKQNPTPKRLRVAAGMRADGYKLQDIQRILYALAQGHRENIMEDFAQLKNIRAKSHVQYLTYLARAIKDEDSQDDLQAYYDRHQDDFVKLGIHSVYEWYLGHAQLGSLFERIEGNGAAAFTQQRDTDEQIKQLEQQVFSMQIPGFFPTPPELVARLIDLAQIAPHHKILEPSAGKGDILDAMVQRFPGIKDNLHAYEINSTLVKILQLKGYKGTSGNFYLSEPEPVYDRVVMNPPFENGQDIDHIRHGLHFLKPGGRLVAVMSESVMTRGYQKDKQFRELLAQSGAYVSEPIREAFKNSFIKTNWTVRIVAIDKDKVPATQLSVYQGPSAPPADPPPQSEPAAPALSEQEQLELEAQAELELLRMRVEQQKRKRGLMGTEQPDSGRLRSLSRQAAIRNRGIEVLDFN